MRRAATATSQDLSTTHGDLPPSSSDVGQRCSAAALATILPTVLPPVKKMWSQRASRTACVARRSPRTTRAPRGSSQAPTSSAMAADVAAEYLSLGSLSTTPLPAAMAPTTGARLRSTG